MDCYFSMRRKDALPFATTWMTLCTYYAKLEKSYRERQVLYDITYIESKRATLVKTES